MNRFLIDLEITELSVLVHIENGRYFLKDIRDGRIEKKKHVLATLQLLKSPVEKHEANLQF